MLDINITPEAKPSIPSNQFIAFIIPTIQRLVNKRLKITGKFIESENPMIDKSTEYIPIPMDQIKEANRNWKPNRKKGDKEKISSAKPKIK